MQGRVCAIRYDDLYDLCTLRIVRIELEVPRSC